MPSLTPPDDLQDVVKHALHEDIQTGDIHHALIPESTQATAQLICREPAILCGVPYATAVFHQIDPSITLDWQAHDGDTLAANQVILIAQGSARQLLTAERTAINFLQTLSGTATTTHAMVSRLSDTPCQIVDTRKTIPGLRSAQKYAVRCGGGHNHRMGLHDAFLIKENHIMAAGSIQAAIQRAKTHDPDRWCQVEVENLDELKAALSAGASAILLDNFNLDMMREAVAINQQQAQLEASGGVSMDALQSIAATGVDRISIGSLTKHLQSIDFSMRLLPKPIHP